MDLTSTHLAPLERKLVTQMITRLKVEQWGPFLVGTTAAGGWWYFDASIGSHYGKEVLAALLSAAAISAGFLTTALSILLPLAATAVGKRLHRSGYMPHLLSYLRSALYSCLLLSAFSVVAFFFLPETGSLPQAISTLIIFLAAFAAAALARITEVLINLFNMASQPEKKDG